MRPPERFRRQRIHAFRPGGQVVVEIRIRLFCRPVPGFRRGRIFDPLPCGLDFRGGGQGFLDQAVHGLFRHRCFLFFVKQAGRNAGHIGSGTFFLHGRQGCVFPHLVGQNVFDRLLRSRFRAGNAFRKFGLVHDVQFFVRDFLERRFFHVQEVAIESFFHEHFFGNDQAVIPHVL